MLAVPLFANYTGKVTFDMNLKDAAKAEKAELRLTYPLSDQNQTITKMALRQTLTLKSAWRATPRAALCIFMQFVRSPAQCRR